jgi:hypothetical protein
MAVFRQRAFAAILATRWGDEFSRAYALAAAGFATSAVGAGACCCAPAGEETAMEDDVNSFIASQPLNRMETRLFHDLFDDVYGRTPMIDCAGSMETSPVERLMRQIQSGRRRRRADDRTAGRRAA